MSGTSLVENAVSFGIRNPLKGTALMAAALFGSFSIVGGFVWLMAEMGMFDIPAEDRNFLKNHVISSAMLAGGISALVFANTADPNRLCNPLSTVESDEENVSGSDSDSNTTDRSSRVAPESSLRHRTTDLALD
ncbi:MAG: hypothetical protein EBX40_03340 [Gammaproteobacteria bacterium]|nr:hypothetical protein [Gammaproteobacteria bacterium]